MVLVLNKNSKKSAVDDFLKKVERKKLKEKKGFDPKQITVPIKSFEGIDPVKYQRQLRDEE